MTAPMVDYKIHWLKMMSVPESRAVVGRHDGINGRDSQSPGHMPDPVLVRALRSAHVMLHYDDDGLPALTAAPDTPHRRRLVRLAFLAPDIQRGIVEGRQSAGLTLTQLLKGPIPLDWSQQAARFPFAASPE